MADRKISKMNARLSLVATNGEVSQNAYLFAIANSFHLSESIWFQGYFK